MKRYNWFILGILFFLGRSWLAKAQDVHITIPAENILNSTEFTTVQPVMNTQGNRWWQWDYLPKGAVYPTIEALQSPIFKHVSKPGVYLPASILQWRLANIGGQIPPFHEGDVWPGFKHFSHSPQTWFEPFVWNEIFSPGDINFTFKIPSEAFLNNSFPSGEYVMQVKQNYGIPSPNNNGVTFSPHTFNIYRGVNLNTYICRIKIFSYGFV